MRASPDLGCIGTSDTPFQTGVTHPGPYGWPFHFLGGGSGLPLSTASPSQTRPRRDRASPARGLTPGLIRQSRRSIGNMASFLKKNLARCKSAARLTVAFSSDGRADGSSGACADRRRRLRYRDDKPSTEAAFSMKRTSQWRPGQRQIRWCGNSLIFAPTAPWLPGAYYKATKARRPNLAGTHLRADGLAVQHHAATPDLVGVSSRSDNRCLDERPHRGRLRHRHG